MILSVIVPVYNGESYLDRCIESVELAVSKVSENIEESQIIIIDDGSTDKTPKLCAKLSKRYANIELIRMNDEGVSAARNRGLSMAKGEFVSFVDADDIVDENIFKYLCDAMDDRTIIAGCGFYEWSDSSKKALTDDSSAEAISYSPEEYVAKELLNGNSRCWSKVYRVSALRNLTGQTLRFREGLSIGEDMLFVAECVLAAAKDDRIVELKAYKGYGYYRNPNGAINRPFNLKYMDQIYCWEILRDMLLEAGVNSTDSIKNINTKYIIAIMLTASKISMCDALDVDKYKSEIKTCHKKIKKAMSNPHFLDKGYRVKAELFRLSPKLYMKLYHKWKVN